MSPVGWSCVSPNDSPEATCHVHTLLGRNDSIHSHRLPKLSKTFFQANFGHIEPYNSGFLAISGGHSLYEESGNPHGNPILFLHGGPGAGGGPSHRRYFGPLHQLQPVPLRAPWKPDGTDPFASCFPQLDPAAYRIVLLDQRGAGKSTPPASLVENTTQHLTHDVEALRKHLGIDRWVVFGGSWGSTLAMCYTQAYPDRVKALILRGIFTVRRSELVWLYEKGGAEQLYPDAWDNYVAPIPEAERDDLIGAYYKRLTGTDEDEKLKCAKAWSAWETSIARLVLDPESVKRVDEGFSPRSLQFATIECHYFKHNGFLEGNHVLNNVDTIRHIPCTIIQGRYDIVCPMMTSWQLHKCWPEADYQIVQLAGHLHRDLIPQLVATADKYKDVK